MAKLKFKKEKNTPIAPNNKEETKINGNHKNKPKTSKNRKISEDGNSPQKVGQSNPKTVNKPEDDKKQVITAKNTRKINRSKQKKKANKLHKIRVNELMGHLKNGGAEAKKIVKGLQSIIDENKVINDYQISVLNAKRLLYFQKNGKMPLKEEIVHNTPTVVKQNKSKEPKIKKEKASTENHVKSKSHKEIKKINTEETNDDDYNVEENVTVDKVNKNIKKEIDDEDSSDEHDESMEVEEEEDEEDDDEEEDEKDADDQDNKKETKPKFKKINVKENLKKDGIIQKGQSRYVLFVGNIPFTCTSTELKEHFNITCAVKDVRIPLERNTNKPRGFAYVELTDEASYQKALSLHHSQFQNRVINVLYSQGGKKKGDQSKQKMKAKNFKLHALRQKGLLTCDVKKSQQKAARKAIRQKKNVNKSPNNVDA